MREIKFRTWLKAKKEMFYDFTALTHPTFSEGGLSVLMQYTGLNDKNGKEIYEGDIVQDTKNRKYEVIWDKYMFNLKDYYDGLSDYPTDAFSEGIFEVIGNIYENPDLIK